jgi:thiol-disulfide isomerase/thioredoxin
MSRAIAWLLAGAALATAAGARAGAVGEPAPNCTLASLAGAVPAPGDLEALAGKVVWVDFWASWCPSCAESFPFLDQLDADFRDRGLVVLGVNLDRDPAEAREFLAEHPAGFLQASDPGAGRCPRAFGVAGMPSSYLIDRGGVVRLELRGFHPGEAREARALVEALLSQRAER